MTTEEELIYTIHDNIRAGQFNQDDHINERLMRAFLRFHRGKLIDRFMANGEELTDEIYQELKEIPFTVEKGCYTSGPMPKVIRLKNNAGILADLDGYPVSIVETEEFRNAPKDKFNKYQPLLKFSNSRLYLYGGQTQPNQLEDFSGSNLNVAVEKLKIKYTNNNVSLNVRAVLVNPDDAPGYDFTSSPYPFPDELIEDLVTSVNAREFGLFLRAKSDEIGNLRDDAQAKEDRPD
jgi:hypothetical protein